MRWLAIAISAVGLCACATPFIREGYVPCRVFGHIRECVAAPMASPATDAAAKRFTAPEDGKARVYLLRPYMQQPTKRSEIFLNGQRIGALAPQTYAMFNVLPGRNTIRVDTGWNIQMAFDAEPGRIYYFQYQLNLLFNTVTPHLKVLQEADGKEKVLDTKRVFSEIAF